MNTTTYGPLYLFLAGEWVPADTRDTSPVVNPADGTVLGRVPLATAADLDRALLTAQHQDHYARRLETGRTSSQSASQTEAGRLPAPVRRRQSVALM